MMDTMSMEVVLRNAVIYSLSAELPANAMFMAERLCAMNSSEKNLQLLAKTYLRSGKPSLAKGVLDNAVEMESRYLRAVACIELNLLREAELALRPDQLKNYSQCDEIADDEFPGGSAGIYRLGLVLQRTARKEAAAALYKRAVKSNPLLWVAYEGLLFLGETSDEYAPENLLDEHASVLLGQQSDYLSSSSAISPLDTQSAFPAMSQSITPSAPSTRVFRTVDTPQQEEDDFKTPKPSSRGLPLPRRMPKTSLPSRISGGGRVSFGSTTPSPRGSLDPQALDLTNPSAVVLEDEINSCMTLVRRIAKGFSAVAAFRCGEALSIFSSLPKDQKNTGLILSMMGRSYMEIGDYASAEEMFEEARRVDPLRMDGLVEYYSTVLWHQKKEFELADLARQAIESDRFSAATWCAAGNCFSLQRDPNNALKFFKRAVQVDPWSAYAHTLIGHEYVVKEDLDAAKSAYREALGIDPRHYNAWYGIGHVFQKQENFYMAEVYYKEALKCHPQRATLHYHLGCVLFASGRADEALKALNKAIKLNPNNPVAKFERAKIYASRGKYDIAVEELQKLCESLPREAAVHYEMGRIFKKTSDVDKALKHFAIALNLDPKARAYKKALDSVDTVSNDGDE